MAHFPFGISHACHDSDSQGSVMPPTKLPGDTATGDLFHSVDFLRRGYMATRQGVPGKLFVKWAWVTAPCGVTPWQWRARTGRRRLASGA
jgi:hypothetical protein